jgi:hypothetical protein
VIIPNNQKGKVVRCPECRNLMSVIGSLPEAAADAEADAQEVIEPAPYLGRWCYKMVQVPQTIQLAEGTSMKGNAAAYLQELVDEYAAQGWEFYRVDPVGVFVAPGCLSALLGFTGVMRNYYVVTFRKPAGSR